MLEPFVAALYEIMALRESQFPWWADDLTPAEMYGLIIYDTTAKQVSAEQIPTNNNT